MYFSLAASKILYLSLILGNLIMMCLGVFPLWVQILWNSLSFLDFLEVYFLHHIGEFSFIIFSNKFSISCSSSFPSGTPMIWMLEHLQLSRRFLSPSSFCNSCFFILFQLDVYFFLLFQIIDLSPGLTPVTVGSLHIFLYFTFHSLHFFL